MQRHKPTDAQFRISLEHHSESFDFLNWYRFFFIIKEILRLKPKSVLEIGEGSGIIRKVTGYKIENYETMDINENLEPAYLGDVREYRSGLKEKYDCVVAADILEHIPFADLEGALKNLHSYLQQDGAALITIPHRAWFVFKMFWLFDYKHFILRAPDWMRTLYHRLRGRKENPIDRDHEWEIGDGRHETGDVEAAMKRAGFKIEKSQKLLYVDFWILKK